MRGMGVGAPAIEVAGLTKDYGSGRGVFDVSFAVQPGEVFGFLGPNGAGKTVTMRHLMGFVQADRGEARIAGLDCFARRAEVQRRVGYLPGELACMDEMTGEAFISLMARMRGLHDLSRARELAELFQLDARAKIRRMSKGTKQKVGIVVAFMARPDILLLDEPTSGLDPLMQSTFIDLVRRERDRGATVLLSSHLFEEVERTCDRVGFIRAGRLAAIERMDDVRTLRGRTFEVTFANPEERERFLAGWGDSTGGTQRRPANVPDAQGASDTGTWTAQASRAYEGAPARMTATTSGQGALGGADVARSGERGMRIEGLRGTGGVNTLVRALAGYDVADLETHEQTLEELFMHLYGRDGSTSSASDSACKEGSR